MNNNNYLVVDIEVAPKSDSEVPPFVLNYFKEKRWSKVYSYVTSDELMKKDRCYHPALSKVICCCLKTSDDFVLVKGNTEYEIIEQFWQNVGGNFGNLLFVTFNGYRFLFPYLVLKSEILGVKFSYLPIRKYDMRHFDVRLELSGRGRFVFGSLYFWASVFGIDFSEELAEIDIEEVYNRGDMNIIYDHCTQDVILIEKIFLRICNSYMV